MAWSSAIFLWTNSSSVNYFLHKLVFKRAREREDFALGTGLWESEFVETMWGSSLPLHSRLPSTHMLVM